MGSQVCQPASVRTTKPTYLQLIYRRFFISDIQFLFAILV